MPNLSLTPGTAQLTLTRFAPRVRITLDHDEYKAAVESAASGFKSPEQWSHVTGDDAEALRGRLKRARMSHRLTDSEWFENTERQVRGIKFFYARSAVEKVTPRRVR